MHCVNIDVVGMIHQLDRNTPSCVASENEISVVGLGAWGGGEGGGSRERKVLVLKRGGHVPAKWITIKPP